MKTINLAILFSGNGSNLENIYKKMQNAYIVVSPNKSAQESGENEIIMLNFSIAISSNKSAFGITRCKNLGLKCEVIDYKTNKGDFFEKIIAVLESHNINLVILAGFMKILPPKFNAKFNAINIHPSILPLFKGAHAIEQSYQSDMKIAGVSVHFVNDELDGGALIAQDIIQKIDGESFESFESRIHALEYEIYPKAIEKAVQILARNPQFFSNSKDFHIDLRDDSCVDLQKDSHDSRTDSQKDSRDLRIDSQKDSHDSR